jgi:pimeloyl-ACP methyl ester carboxylesterase
VSRILIGGINTLLGSHCAARWLQLHKRTLLYADDVSKESALQWVANAAEQIASSEQPCFEFAQVADLLQPAAAHFSAAAGTQSPISEGWFFADISTGQTELNAFGRLLPTYADGLPPHLNYVQSGYSSVDPGEGPESQECPAGKQAALVQQLKNICASRNIQMRIVETPLITGKPAAELVSHDIISEFLAALHTFKAEIEERSPQYFDFHALRCFAPEEAELDMITASQTSQVLLENNSQVISGLRTRLTGEVKISFASFCDHISTVFNLSLLPVSDLGTLNAVDRLFRERVYFIQTCLGPPDQQTGAKDCHVAHIANSGFGDQAQLEFLESTKQNLDEAVVERKKRIANLPAAMVTKNIQRSGSELTYYLAGSSGPVVLLLNALGQGLEYWYRLIDCLASEYRVIIWEPRGTTAPPQPFGMADQVDDLQAIVENENLASCHAVCWCTSPKVAIDFHLRHPSLFLSLTFLNSTFKCEGGPEDFDTPYEKNLFSLCRMLMRKPEMAASVMKTFQSRAEESELEILEIPDAEEMSTAVLAMMSSDLKPHVLGPFKTEATTLSYARQMMDFWANDCRSKAADVTVPVLLIGAEHDQIISPESSEFGATLFPDARYVRLTGATHYFLYDRASALAALLKKFFESPAELPVGQTKQEMVASAS